MKLRQFAMQVVLTCAVLLAANVAVSRLAANSVPRQLLRKIDRSEPVTDVFLGNSTMAAGCDEAAFEAAAPGHRALNLGLGATTPIEHFLLIRRLTKHGTPTIYYGFLDTQLTDAAEGSWDALVGNRAMSYYAEPEIAMGFLAGKTRLGALAFRSVGWIPMLAERGTIWAKVELLRRSLAGVGMAAKETNRFGRAEDFAQLEVEPDVFVRQCRRAVDEWAKLSEPVAAIFKLAKERGFSLVVLAMPMPESHRTRYYRGPEWTAYQAWLTELVREAGGSYVDASDWIGDDGFADHLHVNAEGALVFSRRLGKWTASRR